MSSPSTSSSPDLNRAQRSTGTRESETEERPQLNRMSVSLESINQAMLQMLRASQIIDQHQRDDQNEGDDDDDEDDDDEEEEEEDASNNITTQKQSSIDYKQPQPGTIPHNHNEGLESGSDGKSHPSESSNQQNHPTSNPTSPSSSPSSTPGKINTKSSTNHQSPRQLSLKSSSIFTIHRSLSRQLSNPKPQSPSESPSPSGHSSPPNSNSDPDPELQIDRNAQRQQQQKQQQQQQQQQQGISEPLPEQSGSTLHLTSVVSPPNPSQILPALTNSVTFGELSSISRQSSRRPRSNSNRKLVLARKLREIFNLPRDEQVLGEYSCWLYRSILLRGYLFLTEGHVCYYAYLRSNDRESDGDVDGDVIKSGMLTRCHSGKLKQKNVKSWYILKDSTLSWYPSNHEPYFPTGQIDLHFCTKIESSSSDLKHSTQFRLFVSSKVYTFVTDTQQARAAWVKALKQVVFACQHDGENVRIAIPLSAVETVEQCQSIQFAETVRIKTNRSTRQDQKNQDSQAEALSSSNPPNSLIGDVSKNTSHAVLDDYFFGFIHDSKAPFEMIQTTLAQFMASSKTPRAFQERSLQGSSAVTHDPDAHHASPPSHPQYLIQDSTRNAILPTLASRDPMECFDGSNPGGDSHDSSASFPGTNEPSPQRAVISITDRIRKISSTGNKLVGSPIRSASGIIKVKNPVGFFSSTGSASQSTQSAQAVICDSPSGSAGEASDGDENLSAADRQRPTSSTRRSGSSPSDSYLKDSHTYPPNHRPQFSTFSPQNKKPKSIPRSSLPPNSQSPDNSSWGLLPGWLKSVPNLNSLMPPSSKTILSSAKNMISPSAESDRGSNEKKKAQEGEEEAGDFKTIFGAHEGKLTDREEFKFRQDFNFVNHPNLSESDRMRLIFKTSCNLIRSSGSIVYGQLYLSQPKRINRNNFKKGCICFKGTKKISNSITKMILPINEIVEIESINDLRFRIVALRSEPITEPEERLEFEFLSSEQTESIKEHVSKLIEKVKNIEAGNGDDYEIQEGERMELRAAVGGNYDHDNEEEEEEEESSSNQLPIMFGSTSSSFLTFKPKEPLHITCLTIGSRGDVQPYIALCQALIKDGHTCRIASHGEYRRWVEGYGIEFVEIGGDPAELMKICVDNGMFTLGFLKEGLTKFRGWLDELLVTSYEACKGTDLLIESPSTMSGIHIAEALEIPYFRAFTMPWTRTREYPHAFAVPDHKMGGGYNYMTYTVFDQVFWRAISGQVNRWRKQTLKLKSTTYEKLESHKVPFLYNFSPTIVPSPIDWFEWVHITGYWFLDESMTNNVKNDNNDYGDNNSATDDKIGKGKGNEDEVEGKEKGGILKKNTKDEEDQKKNKKSQWEPEPDLVKFIERAKGEGKKIVYIGFGSIVVPDPEGMTRTIVEAVEKANVYAIVTKGWSDRLKKKDEEPERKTELLLKKLNPMERISRSGNGESAKGKVESSEESKNPPGSSLSTTSSSLSGTTSSSAVAVLGVVNQSSSLPSSSSSTGGLVESSSSSASVAIPLTLPTGVENQIRLDGDRYDEDQDGEAEEAKEVLKSSEEVMNFQGLQNLKIGDDEDDIVSGKRSGREDETDEKKRGNDDDVEEEEDDDDDDFSWSGSGSKIYNLNSVPHDWLFPRIDAACHHGGAGTTGASLRAGIPTIIRPFFGDQYFWAERVETLGIGTGLRKMNVKNLSQALINATTDEVQIRKAKIVGEQIRSESGTSKAVECIYRDLEYAKSLIKRRSKATGQASVRKPSPNPIETSMVKIPSDSANSSSSSSPKISKRSNLKPTPRRNYSSYSTHSKSGSDLPKQKKSKSNSNNQNQNLRVGVESGSCSSSRSISTELPQIQVESNQRSSSTGASRGQEDDRPPFSDPKTVIGIGEVEDLRGSKGKGLGVDGCGSEFGSGSSPPGSSSGESRVDLLMNRSDGSSPIKLSPPLLSQDKDGNDSELKKKEEESRGGCEKKNGNSHSNSDEESSWDILSQSRSEPVELSSSFDHLSDR